MPQVIQITLNDGSTDVPFAPNGVNGNIGTWINGNGVIIGNKVLSASTRLTPLRRKITIKLSVPVVQDEVINGISNPVSKRVAYATVEFDFAKQAVTADRTALRSMIASALASEQFIAVIDNNEDFF